MTSNEVLQLLLPSKQHSANNHSCRWIPILRVHLDEQNSSLLLPRATEEGVRHRAGGSENKSHVDSVSWWERYRLAVAPFAHFGF
ncbi:hypothetical protein Pla52o_44300 [Novipirellula galeiformis]|uniref:Uncharacterized protein n=1 Tax=Novipirellula galeiformis TaxID=2528004 RepID=A0A5C6C8P9_9BACT|nr:hypothetical protein Pla52o_44300 [Novipirellula galeiformis]